MSKSRTQFRSENVADPESLRVVLNDFALEICSRLEALESAKGITILPDVSFETGAKLDATTAPFTQDGAGMRVSCPFSPTGLVLLQLTRVSPAGSPIIVATSDVKWHYAAGAAGGAGDGVVHIDFVTGLAVSSRYVMRLGVFRA